MTRRVALFMAGVHFEISIHFICSGVNKPLVERLRINGPIELRWTFRRLKFPSRRVV
jgi:hypothetical protein